MHFNAQTFAVVLSTCSLALAKPIAEHATPVERAAPSPYPYGDPLPNEFLWLGWDADDAAAKADGKKIHEAFKQWSSLAAAGLKAAQEGKSNVRFKRWFNSPDADDTKAIQNTFANMYDKNTKHATANIKKMVLERKDFGKHCGDQNWLAYTQPDTGHFHICPDGIALKQQEETKCDDFFYKYMHNAARTLSFALLHEYTHFDAVADDRLGLIEDHAVNSLKCFQLDTDEKMTNANNYAWLAADQYWTEKCPDKEFGDPAPQGPTPPDS